MDKALILFAKTPRPGKVKTRLQPDISPEEASKLYQAFVLDLLGSTRNLEGTVRFLSCDPSKSDPYFKSLGERDHLDLIDQRGSDLGQRMRNAFEEVQAKGFERLVIIGTDCPNLSVKLIQKAFSYLEVHDLVLGPSRDGGYYLIGCRGKVPPIFDGIPWSGDQVFRLTLKRVMELNVNCALLPFWYDVDTMDDLRFLSSHLEFLDQQGGESGAPETARFLKTLKL